MINIKFACLFLIMFFKPYMFIWMPVHYGMEKTDCLWIYFSPLKFMNMNIKLVKSTSQWLWSYLTRRVLGRDLWNRHILWKVPGSSIFHDKACSSGEPFRELHLCFQTPTSLDPHPDDQYHWCEIQNLSKCVLWRINDSSLPKLLKSWKHSKLVNIFAWDFLNELVS